MVSLDTIANTDHFMQLVEQEGLSAFWAGGELSRDKRLLRWENGRLERITKGKHPWSFTGTRGPQPDGQESEHCLAVLNNAYNVKIEMFLNNLYCSCSRMVSSSMMQAVTTLGQLSANYRNKILHYYILLGTKYYIIIYH